eukprot:TRINITY_DN40224_c1_g1_i1.p1 TRINITY_DN40224_c1_g1~~TRINITY_DN40224_c1_g1_i1.p1  ORF type:complete len:538 (-),score=77.40 TRINITY_DN40224_c1_g1_i1:158-1708(-)
MVATRRRREQRSSIGGLVGSGGLDALLNTWWSDQMSQRVQTTLQRARQSISGALAPDMSSASGSTARRSSFDGVSVQRTQAGGVGARRRLSLAAAMRKRGGLALRAESDENPGTPPLRSPTSGKAQAMQRHSVAGVSGAPHTPVHSAPQDGNASTPTSHAATMVPRLALDRNASDENMAARGPESSHSPPTARSPSSRVLVAQMNEFLGRGKQGSATSRAPLASARLGTARGAPSGKAATDRSPLYDAIDWQVAAWVAKTNTTDVRLSNLRTASGRSASSACAAQEASLVFLGVEVVVHLSAATDSDLTSDEASREAITRSLRVVSQFTRTPCEWPDAQRRVRAAAAACEGQSLARFLDALLEAWRAHHDEMENAPGRRGSVTTSGSSPGPRSQTPPSTSSSTYSSDLSGRGDDVASSTAPTEAPGRGQSSLEGEQRPISTLGESFRRWLDTKRPLFRFEHAAVGLSWDFPLAKAEKKELFILHLAGEQVGEQLAPKRSVVNARRSKRRSRVGTRR